MAENSSLKIIGGPYDSTSVVEEVNGFPRGDKAIDAAFVASMIDSLITSGIVNIDSHQLEVTPGDGLSVKVSPGVAWARGYMARLNSSTTVELSAGHTFGIFIRQDHYTGEARLISVMDDFGGVPVRNPVIYDLLLCKITIPEGADSITVDMIEDKRSQGVCGYATSRL